MSKNWFVVAAVIAIGFPPVAEVPGTGAHLELTAGGEHRIEQHFEQPLVIRPVGAGDGVREGVDGEQRVRAPHLLAGAQVPPGVRLRRHQIRFRPQLQTAAMKQPRQHTGA